MPGRSAVRTQAEAPQAEAAQAEAVLAGAPQAEGGRDGALGIPAAIAAEAGVES
jgi:hypothetical protein